MSPDKVIADAARELVEAMLRRARTRLADDQKKVLELQTKLCRVVREEDSGEREI